MECFDEVEVRPDVALDGEGADRGVRKRWLIRDADPVHVTLAKILDQALFAPCSEVGAPRVVERGGIVQVVDEVVVAG